MVLPGDIISPNAEIYEIPCEEWLLDFNQSAALARFEATAQRAWHVRRFKADSVSYWSIEDGDESIIDLALTRALRLALETE